MPECQQARYTVQRRTEVISVPLLRRSCVQSHAYPQSELSFPDFVLEEALGRESRTEALCGGRESRTESISYRLENRAVVILNSLSEQGVMAGEGFSHGFRILFPKPGAALDVGKEEGDCSARQAHH